MAPDYVLNNVHFPRRQSRVVACVTCIGMTTGVVLRTLAWNAAAQRPLPKTTAFVGSNGVLCPWQYGPGSRGRALPNTQPLP